MYLTRTAAAAVAAAATIHGHDETKKEVAHAVILRKLRHYETVHDVGLLFPIQVFFSSQDRREDANLLCGHFFSSRIGTLWSTVPSLFVATRMLLAPLSYKTSTHATTMPRAKSGTRTSAHTMSFAVLKELDQGLYYHSVPQKTQKETKTSLWPHSRLVKISSCRVFQKHYNATKNFILDVIAAQSKKKISMINNAFCSQLPNHLQLDEDVAKKLFIGSRLSQSQSVP
jgi:hypothetical protein